MPFPKYHYKEKLLPPMKYKPPKNNLAYIIAFGPEPAENIYGDEYPVWNVIWCDSNDDEITSLTLSSRNEVIRLGEKAAKEARVEFINEAGFP